MVAPAAAWKQVLFRQVPDPGHEWDGAELDVRPSLEVGEVADEAIARNVRGRCRAGADHRLGGGAVERRHHRHRLTLEAGRTQPALDRGRDQARAERLGQVEEVARPRPIVRDHAVGMHLADHRIAEFRLGVVHGMTADDRDPGLRHLRSPAGHDLFQQAGVQLLAWKRGDAKREERPRAHRVDVAESVGRRNRAELRRVVDDGREEIDRRDEGAVGRDSIDRRIVAAGRGDQHVGVDDRGQSPQYLP